MAKKLIVVNNKTSQKIKKKANQANKAGRPKFIINYDLVQRLGQIHCTIAEIANILECSTRTLDRNDKFCLIYRKALAMSKMSLRRHQWKLIEAGNCTMQIFIGKNILGQRDIVVDMEEKQILEPIKIVLASNEKPEVFFKDKDKSKIDSKIDSKTSTKPINKIDDIET